MAAHKLATRLEIFSCPDRSVHGPSARPFRAVIDWDRIEELNTLDEVTAAEDRSGLTPDDSRRPPLILAQLTLIEVPEEIRPHGTRIVLHPLRRTWTAAERIRLYNEAQELQFPNALLNIGPQLYPGSRLINFAKKAFQLRDTLNDSPEFNVELTGDFSVGESFWQTLLSQKGWLLEIDATSKNGPIKYQISPSAKVIADPKTEGAEQSSVISVKRPAGDCPRFSARLVIRDGQVTDADALATEFVRKTFGVRVYVEGFRVLPYGEAGNDWLKLDYDYARRTRKLEGLDSETDDAAPDKDAALSLPSGRSVFGAVVMTQESSTPLRMLVNREGFVPDAAYDSMVEVIKSGINFYVRQKAAASLRKRQENKRDRNMRRESISDSNSHFSLDRAQRALDSSVSHAREQASRATQLAKEGNLLDARNAVSAATESLYAATHAATQVLPEQSLVRILASVGLQLGAFVHEVRAVHAMSASVRSDLERFIAKEDEISAETRRFLKTLTRRLSDLTQSLERHASYLTDALSVDSRRRRSPQPLAICFEKASRLVELQIERKKIALIIEIDSSLKTPAMFASELTLILTNLLTNAVKATEDSGRILCWSKSETNGLSVTVENTGEKVDLSESDRWFHPFESKSTAPDPILGVGMGMGLPITRNMIETYGGQINFVRPSRGFSTAISFSLPRK